MNIRTGLRLAAFVSASLVFSTAAHAGEPLFGYLYTTDTLPKGKVEVEQWITDREGQAHGHYHGLNFRTEAEVGATNNLQLSLYKNYTYIDAANNSVEGYTEGSDLPPDHNGLTPYRGWHSDGVSFEGTWRVRSPYTHNGGVGFALQLEYETGPKEKGLEFRIIAQKNFLQDRLVVVSNTWIEFEKEQGSNLGNVTSGDAPSFVKDKATYLEQDLGVSYRFRPKWSAGVELRNHNEFGGWGLSDQDHTAFFLGPNIHYGGERWFATLSALYQIGAHAFSDDQRAQMYHGKLYGDEHTTWDGIRLIFGRTF